MYNHRRGIKNLLNVLLKVLQEDINLFGGWGAEHADNAYFFFVISTVLLQKDLELFAVLLAG